MCLREPRALITGVTGQDGSYLSELLLLNGYKVCGMNRRTSTDNCSRIQHLLTDPNFSLAYGDLSDMGSLLSLLKTFKPTEVYNLGSQSDVGASFKLPIETADITGVGVLRLLEAIRQTDPTIKFYQASSSEMFGDSLSFPQSETTPFRARSPYGAAKIYGYHVTKNYREAYDMFTCNGILFNHESPRRGDSFVTKKIAKQMVSIWKREQGVLELGNLDAFRDWGHAGDYVIAMWLMLQQDRPDDYVIATGKMHTVRDFVIEASKVLGMKLLWHGKGKDEYATCNGDVIVRVNPKFYRPTEVAVLCGDTTKAKNVLGWHPSISFHGLVREMVEAEL